MEDEANDVVDGVRERRPCCVPCALPLLLDDGDAEGDTSEEKGVPASLALAWVAFHRISGGTGVGPRAAWRMWRRRSCLAEGYVWQRGSR